MESLTNAKVIHGKAQAKLIAAGMTEYFNSPDHFIHQLEIAYFDLTRSVGYEKAREVARELADRPW